MKNSKNVFFNVKYNRRPISKYFKLSSDQRDFLRGANNIHPTNKTCLILTARLVNDIPRVFDTRRAVRAKKKNNKK